MKREIAMRPMTRDEVDVLVGWAAQEGWNPGHQDAEIFWQTDPQGFIAAELGGQMVGGGAIVSYGGRFGFMGLFIMHPDYRGHGWGNQLWHHRLATLRARLTPSAAIGMDGVFAMQSYYAKGGFRLVARDLRFKGENLAGSLSRDLVPLADVPWDQVLAYDTAHFPAPRPVFLRAWIQQPQGQALGVVRNGRLCGYGVIRACLQGFKIGPLFADDADTAEDLFSALSHHAQGQPVFLDVPEDHPAAVNLARRHGMQEVFGCARMYFGPPPGLPLSEIFGVTTFELG